MSAASYNSSCSEYQDRVHQEMKDLEQFAGQLLQILNIKPGINGRNDNDNINNTKNNDTDDKASNEIDWESLPPHLRFYAAEDYNKMWVNIVLGYFELRDQLKMFALKEKCLCHDRRVNIDSVTKSLPPEERLGLVKKEEEEEEVNKTSRRVESAAAVTMDTLPTAEACGQGTEACQEGCTRLVDPKDIMAECYLPYETVVALIFLVMFMAFNGGMVVPLPLGFWFGKSRDEDAIPYQALFRG